MSARRPAVWAFAATAALFVVGGVVYLAGTDVVLTDVLDAALFAAVMLGVSALGVLIAGREPGNPIGWLFSIVPLCVALAVGSGAIADWAGPGRHDLPGAVVPAWLSLWTWPVGLLAFAMFLPLLFPDGRPPAGRWGLLVRFDLAALLLFALVLMTQPGDGNPVGTDAAPRTAALPIAVVLIVVGMLAGLASAFVRYRRAGPTERVQMRACLFAVCLTFTGFVTISLLFPREALYTLDYALIPLAVGLAILRYRLYEVDVVIRRTLVYAVLVAALAAVYLGGIAVFGMTFRAATGLESSFAVTLSTLAVAAAFHPFRRRIQDAVDRRFSRAAYDAEAAIASFAGELREQIDLDVLSDRMLETVRETVRPRTASVWLAPVTIPERGSGRTEA